MTVIKNLIMYTLSFFLAICLITILLPVGLVLGGIVIGILSAIFSVLTPFFILAILLVGIAACFTSVFKLTGDIKHKLEK